MANTDETTKEVRSCFESEASSSKPYKSLLDEDE